MILCPFNGESIRKCVYGNNLLVRGEQLIKFVAILKPDDCIFDHICAPRRNTTWHPNSVCVCVSVCVRDCYFVVNVLDLPFASPITIYR